MVTFFRGIFFSAILTLVIIPTSAVEVQAYFDPGTGSQLLQLLLASLLGALFTIKMYWKRLKDLVKNFFTKESKKIDD